MAYHFNVEITQWHLNMVRVPETYGRSAAISKLAERAFDAGGDWLRAAARGALLEGEEWRAWEAARDALLEEDRRCRGWV